MRTVSNQPTPENQPEVGALADQRLVGIPIPADITDPKLVEIAEGWKAGADEILPYIQGGADIITAIDNRNAGPSEVRLRMEEKYGEELVRDFYAIGPRLDEGVIRTADPESDIGKELYWSQLSLDIDMQTNKSSQVSELTSQIEKLVDHAVDSEMDISISAREAEAMGKAVRGFADQFTEDQSEDYFTTENFIALAANIQALPTTEDMNTLLGMAYFDSLKAYVGEGAKKHTTKAIRHQARTLHSEFAKDNPEPTAMKLATAHLAARAIDIAIPVNGISADSKNKRNLTFAGVQFENVIGISKLKGSWIMATDRPYEARSLNNLQRLILNSQEIKLQSFAFKLDLDVANRILGSNSDLANGLVGMVEDVLRELIPTISEMNDEFYLNISGHENIEQLLKLEEYKNATIAKLIAQTSSAIKLHHDELCVLESYTEPKLLRMLEQSAEQTQLESLKSHIDNLGKQIDKLDEPHVYRSSRIRSFEGGKEYLRNLEVELDKQGLNTTAEILQTLAILILQSQTTKDKEQFFTDLSATKAELDNLLAELDFFNAQGFHTSKVSNALAWLNEIVDSGKDELVHDRRLKNFIYDYFIGPDESITDQEEPETTSEDNVEPPIEEIEETEEPETQLEEETEELIEEPTPETPRPTQRDLTDSYISAVAEVLEGVEIHHVDIDAFPPGSKRTREGTNTNRSDQGGFLDIDPERVKKIADLKQSLEYRGLDAELIYTNRTPWSALPQFVLFIQDEANSGRGVCLMESPINGNATYAFTVDGQLVENWQDMAVLPKQVARELGADTFIHPTKGANNFDQHYDLVLQNHVLLTLSRLRQLIP